MFYIYAWLVNCASGGQLGLNLSHNACSPRL